MSLPPNVDQATFDAALTAFRDAIGAEWVFSSEQDQRLYRDAYDPYMSDPDRMLTPCGAVAPRTVEEVQAIVGIANEYRIPLFPISTGKNLGYGGSAPYMNGTMIVDLKRMTTVIEVNEDRNYAIVEPGVTYYDLYDYVQERGLNVWIDCPDPGWGSVVGNAMDRGVGYTYSYYRDHWGCHAGLEVVLPNGEVLRTGMGAIPNGEMGNYRYGFGPAIDGLFSQGSFGIVTKMAIHLMPEPESYFSGTISVPRREDIIPLVNNVNKLDDQGLIGQPNYGSPGGAGSAADPEFQAMMAQGFPSDQALNNYVSSRGRQYWQVRLQFYGPEQTVMSNWDYAKRLMSEIPGAQFEDGQLYRFPMSDEDKHEFPNRVAIGVPNMEIFRIVPMDGLLYFAALAPRSGESILRGQRVFGDMLREMNMPGSGPFSGAATWHPRTFILINGFPLSRTDEAHNARAREAFVRCVEVAAAEGWGEYRTPPQFVNEVAGAYSFNNSVQRRFTEILYDAADPNGIMAPGRGGVWPRYVRENQA